jgi:hypothetical protein
MPVLLCFVHMIFDADTHQNIRAMWISAQLSFPGAAQRISAFTRIFAAP